MTVRVEPAGGGFVAFREDGESESVAWSEVNRVLAYKVDCSTYDMIWLAFERRGSGEALRVPEEAEGFTRLMSALAEALPGVGPEWYFEVMQPAFAENLTVLFEREAGADSSARPPAHHAGQSSSSRTPDESSPRSAASATGTRGDPAGPAKTSCKEPRPPVPSGASVPTDPPIAVGQPYRTLYDLMVKVEQYDEGSARVKVLPAGSLFQPWEPLAHWRGECVPITLGEGHQGFDWGVTADEGHFMDWDDFLTRCAPAAPE